MKIKFIPASLIAVTIISLSSCKIENIEYRRFENLSLNVNGSNTVINLNLIFYNPNKVGCRIKEMGCFIINSNDTLAIASCDVNAIKLKPGAEFSIPVSSNISPKSVLKLTSKSLFSKTDIAFNFSGTVTIQKFIFKRKYKFNVTEKL
jgi:hypothetical protein